MTNYHPTRRTGLGRRVADIVGGAEPALPGEGPGGLLAGPAVVPLEVVPVAMLVADASGRVLTVNRRWVSLSGLQPSESRGLGWLAVLHPEDRLRLRLRVEKVAAGAGGGAEYQWADAGGAEYQWADAGGAEYQWADAGGRRATWWLSAHQVAGERLVGIAVEPTGPTAALAPTGPARPCAARGHRPGKDPVLGELPALLQSVRSLLDALDRLVERLPLLEAVPG